MDRDTTRSMRAPEDLDEDELEDELEDEADEDEAPLSLDDQNVLALLERLDPKAILACAEIRPDEDQAQLQPDSKALYRQGLGSVIGVQGAPALAPHVGQARKATPLDDVLQQGRVLSAQSLEFRRRTK